MQDLQISDNEHLEDIMPTLYKIVTQVKQLAESTLPQITKIYITGMGTSINNIDLYFQEYIPTAKCELLKPFFVSDSAALKLPIKEYMEVNSATALALDGLGYGEKDLNFKGRNGGSIADIQIDSKTIKNFFMSLVDTKKEMNAFDKTVLRLAICLCVGVVTYGLASNSIIKQIDDKSSQIDTQLKVVNAQIETMNSQISSINSGKNAYDKMYDTLEQIKNPPASNEEDSSSDGSNTNLEDTVIPKNAIPNLLNRIVYTIPTQVRITSIKNTIDKHIVIEAQASKYEQLGYFRSALENQGYLENIKSTSGIRSGGTVVITIEGDLP